MIERSDNVLRFEPVRKSSASEGEAKSTCKTLQEARERILSELPPKPIFTGMSEFQAAEVAMNWLLDANFIYKSAVFGLPPEVSEI
ncbi:hypothetical protein [Sphingorhabdus lacus]|uniref:Uncharacterized protein n=1 Tax=Sphingorhabdus lacus TaxID=392610 RepID=A0A6I6LAB9_9SPHN|nr:hypothetical protein [Sphingorhabdus lacus]QGY81774.1 hypothetical protein EUU25_14790 [Sphingorhabdus lacus]